MNKQQMRVNTVDGEKRVEYQAVEDGFNCWVYTQGPCSTFFGVDTESEIEAAAQSVIARQMKLHRRVNSDNEFEDQ